MSESTPDPDLDPDPDPDHHPSTDGQRGGGQPGRAVTALADDRGVRVLVAETTGPARELCRRHGLTGSAARLAAEGVTVAVLLGSQLKDTETLTVNVYGEEPVFTLNVDLRDGGAIRGRLDPTELPGDGREPLRFRGLIGVIKHLGDEELHRGMSEIIGGTVAEGLQGFFDHSIQVDGRTGLRVVLDDAGMPTFAAGMLVERLPDTDPELFRTRYAAALAEDLAGTLTAFAFGQLAGTEVEVLEMTPVIFRCSCSMERVQSMLRTLGPDEIQELIDEQGGAAVTCHFCNEVYRVDADGLLELLGD